MRPSRIIVPVALALTAAAVVAGPGAGASSAPVIAGTTVIEASQPMMMRVTVPHAALISFDASKSVAIDGRGRVVGIRMVEEHQQPAVLEAMREPAQLGGRTYVSGEPASEAQTGDCSGGGLPFEVYGVTPAPAPCAYKYSGQARVRRGLYRLYVVTDGSPVRVTLHFDNLSGSTVLRPTATYPLRLAAVSTTLTGTGAPIFTGGDSMPTATDATLKRLFAWWTQDKDERYVHRAVCEYTSGDALAPAQQQLAARGYGWLPDCAGSNPMWSAQVGIVNADVTDSTSYWDFAAGHHGFAYDAFNTGVTALGFSLGSPSMHDVGGLALWMPAGPPASQS